MKKFKKVAKSLALVTAVATPCFAAGVSPYSAFFTSVAAEATSSWAIGGASVGLVVGLIGCLFGSHHIKEWSVGAVIICVALLGVNAVVAWL